MHMTNNGEIYFSIVELFWVVLIDCIISKITMVADR